MKRKYLNKILNLDKESYLYDYLKNNFNNFTLAGYIDYLAEKEGSLIALCHVDRNNVRREFSYKDLSLKSSKMANYLKNKGVKKGDIVASVLRNNYEFLILTLAVQKLGAVIMPLQYTNKSEQYNNIFKRANPVCVIADDYEIVQSKNKSAFVLDELNKSCCDFIKICTHKNSNYSVDWENLNEYEKESEIFTNKKVKITDLGYLFSTSGTTGNPKLVMHNYGFALAHYFTGLWYGVKKNQKHFTISDSGWAMASWNIPAVLLHQATLYINDYDRFDAEELLNCIQKEKIKSLCAPRSMLKSFVEFLEKNIELKITNLECISSAGEPIDENDKDVVEKYLGIRLKEGYGMTEVVLPLYENDNTQKISPLYSDVKIDINNESQAGEIVIKGGKIGLLIGYLDDKSKYILYKKPPIQHGKIIWHTSDSGHIDKNGNICCDGRYGNIVKVNDCLVNKSEVEHVIKTHYAVSECVVESKKDEISGNVLTAYVELKNWIDDVSEDNIKQYVKTKLNDYCRPKYVVFKKIERTLGGKPKRNDVVEAPNKGLILTKKRFNKKLTYL